MGIVPFDIIYMAIYLCKAYNIPEYGTLYSVNIFIRSVRFLFRAFEAEWGVPRFLDLIICPIFDLEKLLISGEIVLYLSAAGASSGLAAAKDVLRTVKACGTHSGAIGAVCAR